MWAGGETGPDRLGPAGTSLDKFMEQGQWALWPCWDAAVALLVQVEGLRLSQNGHEDPWTMGRANQGCKGLHGPQGHECISAAQQRDTVAVGASGWTLHFC